MSFVSLSSAAWPASHNDPIVENLSNTQRGYSFLKKNTFNKKKNSFFLSAVERYGLGTLNTEGVWIWNELAICKFLDHADTVWGHFIHVLYVGLQLSTRVTQFLQLQLQNADRPRNFIFQGKECIVLNRYSKPTNTKGMDGCIPVFLAGITAHT
ncbi:hypothetical protein JVT61DRAFT_6755 [Boletus reticuloceps]|uniref:Uncharacterized protein n=1 Tax=Boletus reticuloceps TaxID=495285 RepID=A0A8I2YIY1_9AGAM|nr:hypothetical protein JVT61DRAFT_6755 [Boletus reticuloceps]